MMEEGCARELSPSRQRRSTTSRGAGCRLELLRLADIMPTAAEGVLGDQRSRNPNACQQAAQSPRQNNFPP